MEDLKKMNTEILKAKPGGVTEGDVWVTLIMAEKVKFPSEWSFLGNYRH